MKTTIRLVLSVTLGLLMGIADSSSQVRYTYEQLLGQTVVSNATVSAIPKYANLLREVSTNKVSPKFSPVHIYVYSGGRIIWWGSGTAYTDRGNEWVLTAGHLFGTNTVGTNLFFYSKVQEKVHRLCGIQKVFGSSSDNVKRDKDFDQKTEVDVALALHGPATPIEPFSGMAKPTQESSQFFTLGNTNLLLTSLLSNKTYRPLAIGMNGTPGKATSKFVVFDYRAIEGESGSGFLGNDGFIYLLVGTSADVSMEKYFRKNGAHFTNGISRALMIGLEIGK